MLSRCLSTIPFISFLFKNPPTEKKDNVSIKQHPFSKYIGEIINIELKAEIQNEIRYEYPSLCSPILFPVEFTLTFTSDSGSLVFTGFNMRVKDVLEAKNRMWDDFMKNAEYVMTSIESPLGHEHVIIGETKFQMSYIYIDI